jgi:hypothetical protein
LRLFNKSRLVVCTVRCPWTGGAGYVLLPEAVGRRISDRRCADGRIETHSRKRCEGQYVNKRLKSEEQHTPPEDAFDFWLILVGALVFEPVIEVVRDAIRWIRSARRQSPCPPRNGKQSGDKP